MPLLQRQEGQHQQHLPTNADVFLTCSAFEYGEDAPGGGCIRVFRYPLRAPRDYCAKPFERAVVRLTRESLLVYRPTDRVLYSELMWHDVHEMRHNISNAADKQIYEFGFIMHSDIVVLEVTDAATANGIVASLQLLRVGGSVPVLSLNTRKMKTPTTNLIPPSTSSAAAAAPAAPAAAVMKGTATHALRSISSTGSHSSHPSTLFHTVGRGESGDDVLQRIRRREEEMREAIFYVPPCRPHANFERAEASEPTTRRSQPSTPSSSPAPRPQLPLPNRLGQVDAETTDALPQSSSRLKVTTHPYPGVSETTSGMHDLLQLLEEEEKKANRSLRSQEERIRKLRIQDEARVSRPLHHIDTAVYSSASRRDACSEVADASSSAVHGVCVTHAEDSSRGNCAMRTFKEGTTQPLQIQPRVVQEAMQEEGGHHDGAMQKVPGTQEVLGKRGDESGTPEDVASTAPHVDLPPEGGVTWRVNANETLRPELQPSIVDEQRLSIGGLSLGEALDREKQGETEIPQEGTTTPQPIAQVSDAATTSAAPAPAASLLQAPTNQNRSEAKGGGVLYGSWRELRHKETGRVYYRHTETKEAVWKPPPEVLEMKQQEQDKANNVTAKKGAIRVLGAWKEFRDAKSGRLFYVNSETKQRTWRIEETAFAKA